MPLRIRTDPRHRTKRNELLILTALLLASADVIVAQSKPAAEPVLRDDKLKSYVERFTADDREPYKQAFPNARAMEFLSANIPRFECPDADIERIYYFRWWTFRKHLQQTPDGWVITEFLPKVGWSQQYNTINCAAGHHIREGRWLKDRRFVEDYIRYWLHRGYSPRMLDDNCELKPTLPTLR